MIPQRTDGAYDDGSYVGKCTFEKTEKLAKFQILRKANADAEASAMVNDIAPISINLSPDDELAAYIFIAEDDLEPTKFVNTNKDGWNDQKSIIFKRLFKMEANSDERLVAVATARPTP